MDEHMRKESNAQLGPLARLDLFTDAVFAIVITLLVIEIEVPHDIEKAGLVSALLSMHPIFRAHLISFIVLGIEWFDHHSMFESAHKCTSPLMGSNLLFCLTLTYIPFLTKLFGYFPDSKSAVALYSLGILAMTLGKELIWQVIARQNPSLEHGKWRIRYSPAVCVSVAATGLAMVYPRLAVGVWALFGTYSVVIRFICRDPGHSEVEQSGACPPASRAAPRE